MSRFDEQITTVLEELARDPKDARNSKIVGDALLHAYRIGKLDSIEQMNSRVSEVFQALVKTR